VSDVKATLEDQKIKVQYDAAQANPQDMLTALKKWGDAGNKKVELI
jgi:copper chaperone CopZ